MKYNIQFVEEEKFLGTAGGLKLVQGKGSPAIFLFLTAIL